MSPLRVKRGDKVATCTHIIDPRRSSHWFSGWESGQVHTMTGGKPLTIEHIVLCDNCFASSGGDFMKVSLTDIFHVPADHTVSIEAAS